MIPRWRFEVVGSAGDYSNPEDVCEVLTADGYKRVAEYLDESDASFIVAARDLLCDLLDPEGLGWAATPEIRDRARQCFGIPKCESGAERRAGVRTTTEGDATTASEGNK